MGSSPLARGLPLTALPGAGPFRIIPARAGFTAAGPCRRTACTDHPRSRGVYGLYLTPTEKRSGSSPLARGLRRSGRQDALVLGIIPARAGFTRRAPRWGTSHRDHPRSRGVYQSGLVASQMGLGSSPLARGLPRRVRHASAVARIIPARAGFTIHEHAPGSRVGDHPRSRGVYAPTRCSGGGRQGSSPLARGLRYEAELVNIDPRIIPARAGFTTSRRTRRSRLTDHPRSRGVYYVYTFESTTGLGSSPLARGLLGEALSRGSR